MDSDYIKSKLGLKIKSYRKSKRFSQDTFCSYIDLEQKNLSNIENGKAYPDIKTLINLVKNTDITPEYLLGFLKETEASEYTSIDFEILNLIINLPDSTKEHFLAFLKSLKK